MSWFSLLARRRTASVARERLQILLTHERGASGQQPDLLPMLREEVLAVVARHVAIDPDKVQVKIERGKAVSLLEIDIELPILSGQMTAPLSLAGEVHVQASKLAGAVGRKSAGGARAAAAKPA